MPRRASSLSRRAGADAVSQNEAESGLLAPHPQIAELIGAKLHELAGAVHDE